MFVKSGDHELPWLWTRGRPERPKRVNSGGLPAGRATETGCPLFCFPPIHVEPVAARALNR